MSYFHSNNGLCFERLEDGGVEVTRRIFGLSDDPGLASPSPVAVVDHRWRMTASEWASVVASVSQEGETTTTWKAALEAHGVPSAAGLADDGASL